jgi:hypothetical protein
MGDKRRKSLEEREIVSIDPKFLIMAYNEMLASRIEEVIKDKKNFTTKKMFGGIGFMYNGNMCVGVYKDDLIVRCDAADTGKLLTQKNVKAFDITGKPMKGWLLINPDELTGNGLQKWFDKSLAFVQTLPKK